MPWPKNSVTIRMLTRDLFALANLVTLINGLTDRLNNSYLKIFFVPTTFEKDLMYFAVTNILILM